MAEKWLQIHIEPMFLQPISTSLGVWHDGRQLFFVPSMICCNFSGKLI